MIATQRLRIPFIIATIFLLTIAATTVFAQEEARQSVSTQYSKSDRDSGIVGKVTQDEFGALVTQGSRAKSKRSAVSSEPGAQQSGIARNATTNNDFWIYRADVELFNDHDNDGHFHGIDLLFDADTYFIEADVYAVVYLSLNGGPWNEYSATDNFTLYGTSAEDEYVIVTELVSGYPTGSYDLLIEIFDAYDDSFLASFGPDDTSELAFLPLEDSNRDTPYVEPPIIVRQRGGGSLGWLSLLLLFCAQRIALRRLPES